MKLKKKQLWKSLGAGLTSHGKFKWQLDKWEKAEGKIIACQNGFHGSRRIIDAMRFVNMEVLAVVEVDGASDTSESDKEAWQKMKIIKAWKWEKKDSVELAVFAAEQVIGNFEKQYPNDKRPREAIEAAKKWIKNPTKENRSAAESAAESAWSAEAIMNSCEEFILNKIKELKPYEP